MSAIKSGKIEDVYTLSPLQEGMLFHSIIQKDSSAYFVQMSYRLSGELNVDLVKKSLQELINRHDILRTSFVYKEMDRPLQIVLKERELPFHFEDIRALDTREDKEVFLKEFLEKDKLNYFDIVQDGLMRASIIRVEDQEYEFVWSFHHIVIDGWSMKTLENEFFALYDSFKTGNPVNLPTPVQYKNYIQWLEAQSDEAAGEYWQNYLAGYDDFVRIPQIQAVKGPVEEINNNTYTHYLSEVLTNKISALAQRNRTTASTIIRALWGILVAKYNDTRDVVYGAVVSGRPPQLEDSDDIVGMFINTIPVRVAYDEKSNFSDLLQQINRDSVESQSFHHYPLPEIQNLSERKKQLFDHIIVFENYPVNTQTNGFITDDTEKQQDEDLIQLINEQASTENHYPFYLIIGTRPTLKFKFFYNKELYSEAQVQKTCAHFLSLIERLTEGEDQLIDQLPLVSEGSEEYQELIETYNQTDLDFPAMDSIKEKFEDTAKRHPDRLALHSAYYQYSYQELNKRTNQLANYINEKVAKTEKPLYVAVLVERADFAVIAMLASIKSGAVFVPIHPDLPKEKVKAILEETAAAFLFVEANNMDRVEGFEGELFAIDIQLDMLDGDSDNLTTTIALDDPIYTIYSSGTTGKPKGVIVSHGALLNYANWFQKEFDYSPENRGALLSSHAFDLGYTTIWGGLLNGSALYLPERNIVLDPELLQNYLLEQQITFLKLTPSNFKIVLAAANPEQYKESALQLILIGGEKINPANIAEFLAINNQVRFVNHYGPTETTIGAITHNIDAKLLKEYEQFPLIGSPIANNRAYVLDDYGQALPIGAKGELYLSGKGLANGYLENEALTNKKFINSAWGERIYKTGDKARRHLNGEIEFLGRADDEVKLRGYRISLGEITTVLKAHPLISFATVLVKEEAGDVTLCAYIQCPDDLEQATLMNYLRDRLPGFMMPNEFTRIEEIPLTANGKVDTKQLRKLEANGPQRKIVAPQSEAEKTLYEIWSKVLNKEKISIEDDFFELGGHSLKAVQIISRIITELHITLSVKDIFDQPTIQSLATVVESHLAKEENSELFEVVII